MPDFRKELLLSREKANTTEVIHSMSHVFASFAKDPSRIAAHIESAETNGSMIIIQHYGTASGWQELPTTVDSNESTATASVTSLSPFAITVKSPEPLPNTNTAPLARDDAATVNRGSEVLLDVLANDTDADGDTLTISSLDQGTNGTAEITQGGVTYAHDGSDTNTDTFTYTVIDGNGGTATGTVTVTIAAAAGTTVPESNEIAFGGTRSGVITSGGVEELSLIHI